MVKGSGIRWQEERGNELGRIVELQVKKFWTHRFSLSKGPSFEGFWVWAPLALLTCSSFGRLVLPGPSLPALSPSHPANLSSLFCIPHFHYPGHMGHVAIPYVLQERFLLRFLALSVPCALSPVICLPTYFRNLLHRRSLLTVHSSVFSLYGSHLFRPGLATSHTSIVCLFFLKCKCQGAKIFM